MTKERANGSLLWRQKPGVLIARPAAHLRPAVAPVRRFFVKKCCALIELCLGFSELAYHP
jgi:hypothetical protein